MGQLEMSQRYGYPVEGSVYRGNSLEPIIEENIEYVPVEKKIVEYEPVERIEKVIVPIEKKIEYIP